MSNRLGPVLIIFAILGIIVVGTLYVGESMLPATATAIPSPTAVLFVTTTPKPVMPPDPRIAEFESLGIHLTRQECSAPCASDIMPTVRLGDFVQKAGVPEKVYSLRIGPDYFVHLLYVSRGFIAFANRPADDDSISMTEVMSVYGVNLYNARSLASLEQEVMAVSGVRIPFEKAQDWTGFGPVKSIGQ